jgi:hypothetical protein
LVGASFLCAAAWAAASDDPEAIRVRVAAEQEHRFVLDVVWENKQKAGKKRHTAEGVTHHAIVLAVSEMDTDGNALVKLDVERSWGEYDTGQTGRVVFDSAEDSDIAPMVHGSRHGETWQLTLRPDGTFAELDALLELQERGTGAGADNETRAELGVEWRRTEFLRQLALVFPRLPGRNMPSGTFYEDEMPAAMGMWSYRLDRRNELARKSKTEVVIKAAGKMRDLDAPTTKEAKKRQNRLTNRELRKATFTGGHVVSRADGLPLTSEVKQQMVFVVEFDVGKGSSTQTVELSLRRKAE